MGKSPGGGLRRSSIVNRETLRHQIASCTCCSTTDDIANCLQKRFRKYGRIQQRPFKRLIEQVLQSSEDGNKMKKQRLADESERRSQNCSSFPSSSSDSPSSETDGAVSTSEDAIYGEEVKPEFDLMKSMLRATYAGSNSAAKEKTKVVPIMEKNVELEISSSRTRNKVAMVNGEGLGAGREAKASGSSSGIGGVEVKGKEGPRFRDLGGITRVLDELMMDVIFPLYHPELPRWLGVRPIAGILLHGPPGCGKTKLAHAIANETGVPFYKISATEIVSGVSGASEENIRDLFSKAYRTAPSIVFVDEIDAIASKRENQQREMERRIVTQLMTCMDEFHALVKPGEKDANGDGSDSRPGYVLVIGATNRPDAIDPALRRPGRFDSEIALGVPDENARVQILSVLIRNLRIEKSFDLVKVARLTPGFVGADLAAVADKAGMLAMKRIIDARKCELSRYTMDEENWWRQPWSPEDIESLFITASDFEEAAKMVQPSSKREGFSTIPNVKWEDVGGLDHLRQEFDRYIVRRIKFPEDYVDFGINLETGFLLYGPPGCGKTLIAKAVANEAGANFIHIKGPELLNKYVGESELAVRTLFTRARTCSPCILFFDEVDALTTKRGKEGGWVVERLLNQLLIELDGADQRRGVFVIGATNRPDVMDSAVLRPGRFGKLLYVPLPNSTERASILRSLTRGKRLDATVDLTAIAKMQACENLSGADLAALMNEAAMAALDEKLKARESGLSSNAGTIKTAHFELALAKVSPSVSKQQKQFYEDLSRKLQNGSGRKLEEVGAVSMRYG